MSAKVIITDTYADWVEVTVGHPATFVYVDAYQDQDGEMAAECDFAFTPEAARVFAAALLSAAKSADDATEGTG